MVSLGGEGIRDMIRRPMLFAAAAASAAVFVSYYIGTVGTFIAVFAGSCLMVLHGRADHQRRKRAISLILLISYVLGAVSFWHSDRMLTKEAQELTGDSVTGVITACETRIGQSGDPYVQLIVKTDKGHVLARCYETCRSTGNAVPGCRAQIMGDLQEPAVRRNPGCFDYARYLKSMGITKTVSCSSIKVFPLPSVSQNPAAFMRGKVFLVREGFIKRLTAVTDERTGALIRAILFGYKGSLEEDVLESFQKNGTAHVLAVSGLHIGIIYAFILRLWPWRKGWLFFILNGVFFLLYAVSAGFSPSVTRAVIMVLLHILARIKGWRYDLSNAAFLIVLGVILNNPFMLFNTGFQMSFLAVLSIAVIMPYIRRFYAGLFMMSLVVQIGLGPFILYNFNYPSLLAVVINVPVVALATLIVPTALVAMAACPFDVFDPVCHIIRLLCSILTSLNETTQIDGLTSMQIPSPPLFTMAMYYLCLFVFASEEGRLGIIRAARKGRYILRMLLVVAVLSAGFSAFASDGFGNCNLTFVDVGQGDCVCVKTDGGLLEKNRCFLFDGGGNVNYNVGKSILRDYLLKNGVAHVDGAFVTHLHTDHYKGICELAREGMVRKLYVYEANELKTAQIMEETGLSEDQIEYLGAGDRLLLQGSKGRKVGFHKSDSVYVEVLHPDHRSKGDYERLLADETDENALSLIFRVGFVDETGETDALITGDMGEDGEQELIGKYHAEQGKPTSLRAQILKVGHHGSRTSSSQSFIAAVSPEIAVIQVGKNNYGHPTPETIQRLTDAGAAVYRNDLMGAIGFEIRGNQIKRIRGMIRQSKEIDQGGRL